jgi:enoyl-CoA hydratase/carnithine racemase
MHDPIYVERRGAIAIVVLNRPEKLNAINVAMFRRLREILEDCDRDVDLRCVIVRGADGRAFSVGGDISEFETTRTSAAQAREYARVTHPTFAAIRACRHPVIASIEGLCVGGGLAVATLCDLRICGESSRFGVPVKRLGLVESHDEMEPLVRLVGTSVALELLLTGELMTAATALRVGLVNRVVSDAKVAEETERLAAAIAEGAPLAARWHKQFAYELESRKPLSAADKDVAFQCFDTEDFHVGYHAFLAKSKPQFVGR